MNQDYSIFRNLSANARGLKVSINTKYQFGEKVSRRLTSKVFEFLQGAIRGSKPCNDLASTTFRSLGYEGPIKHILEGFSRIVDSVNNRGVDPKDEDLELLTLFLERLGRKAEGYQYPQKPKTSRTNTRINYSSLDCDD